MGGFAKILKGTGAPERTMPAHVRPMLALLSNLPEHEERYGFEYKWDGIRAVFFMQGHAHRIETRNLTDVTLGYPELVPIVERLSGSTAVLDGEIVAFNERGYPSFGRLQHRLGVTETRARARVETVPITYMLFDVLYLEGRDLTGLPYTERRRVLEAMELSDEHWRTPPSFEGDGASVLEAARENHLEGVVAKLLDGPYREGKRTGEWLKTKLVDRQEFVIGGWTGISTGAPGVGALLIGYHDFREGTRGGGGLVYAGKVGSGYTEGDRRALERRLKPMETGRNPFRGVVNAGPAHFVRPELVAEVEFRGWTNTGHLRQPSYKGLRTDKPARDVVREHRAKSVGVVK